MLAMFLPYVCYIRFEDLKDQLRKRMFKKRRVRRLRFVIFNGLSIELNTYALIRPTNPGLPLLPYLSLCNDYC